MFVGLSADWTIDIGNAMSWLLNVTWRCVEIPIWYFVVEMKVCSKFFSETAPDVTSSERLVSKGSFGYKNHLMIVMGQGRQRSCSTCVGSEGIWLTSIRKQGWFIQISRGPVWHALAEGRSNRLA